MGSHVINVRQDCYSFIEVGHQVYITTVYCVSSTEIMQPSFSAVLISPSYEICQIFKLLAPYPSIAPQTRRALQTKIIRRRKYQYDLFATTFGYCVFSETSCLKLVLRPSPVMGSSAVASAAARIVVAYVSFSIRQRSILEDRLLPSDPGQSRSHRDVF